MRNLIVGVLLAGALALAASSARIAGIDAWKIVLAGLGVIVFVTSGRGHGSPS